MAGFLRSFFVSAGGNGRRASLTGPITIRLYLIPVSELDMHFTGV